MPRARNLDTISSKLDWVAELARRHPDRALTPLHHLMDEQWLHEAYRRTRKDGSVGADGQSAEQYGQQLESNLRDLLDRFRSGRYFAPPVRRAYIPKGDGRNRPIGVPTFEDKVLQRAVAMMLEAVYEQEFHPSSYGFRPGRSAHDALAATWEGLMSMGGGWVYEVDIQSFFDTLDHGQLRAILDERVADGVIRRAIDKWLKAGVLEDGAVRRPGEGTPQGGVISPVLANIYLHTVMDQWFERDVRPRLRGRAFFVRYADDLLLAFEREDDARRVAHVLPKRFAKYGLSLHPEKTRLVAFQRPGPRDGGKGRASFDLLGFTHHWGRSRKGKWIIKQRTMRSRLSRALSQLQQWCRRVRHLPLGRQSHLLGQKLRGHYGYYGITGNYVALARFYRQVRRIWRKWLGRRSNSKRMSWARFTRLEKHHPLPRPRVVHSRIA